MSERGWVATCPVCKWSALVFTREGAEAARSAHERMSKHRGVAAHPPTEPPPWGESRPQVGNSPNR